ncbi:class I SAM-dependent methyltransferase [candidate division KSB1 bacterium]
MSNNKLPVPNGPIDLDHFKDIRFREIVDDIHSFMKVPERKRNSVERCRGRSLLEPAVFESYKHWDNPWAILNAELGSGMKILDCGSGRGILQFYLASKGIEVHSIDISDCRSKITKKLSRLLNNLGIRNQLDPEGVHRKLNRKYKVNVSFTRESAEELSFPDNTFDRVFSISVIEHMPDNVIMRSMREMERVLKPGGLLLLTFDYHPEEEPGIIGFTENDFREKALGACTLKIKGNEPDFGIPGWGRYISSVNSRFRTRNPNTSFGIALKKSESDSANE